jgi:chemotaxis protein MotB
MFVIRGGLLLALLGVGGCQWVPKSKFEAAQNQNRTLRELNKTQLAEIENLKIHAHNIEDHLIKAEEDLARLDEQHGRDRQKLANLNGERSQLRQQFAGLRGNNIPAGISGRLAELARRYPSLQYDPQTGISKLDTDVLFDSGKTELKPEVKQLLAEFADIFAAPDARELKIMVVGHTDSKDIKGREVRERYPSNWHLSAGRALTVADYLRNSGIPEDRMGVAGFGQFQPLTANDTATARQKNRRVEIFLLGPETPVVGWTDNHADKGVLR